MGVFALGALAMSLGMLRTPAALQQNQNALDAAFRKFWQADDPAGAERAARGVEATGAGFDALLETLKRGRAYGRARTGRVDMPTHDEEITLDNIVEIPSEYDHVRAWPVRVSLHGGVGRQPPPPEDPPARTLVNRMPIPGEIVILPRAWANSAWWTAKQVENVSRLLDSVKRRYNVDESRVYITGFSDGGTGVYFFAMREATPWAACMPLHGQPLVLAKSRRSVDGLLFPANVANCPLRMVNGGRDPLYPAASVAPFADLFRRAGGVLEFQVNPDAAHDLSWWPADQARFQAFLEAHPRIAHPDRISWETERTDRYNRFRWIVIERLGSRSSDRPLEDLNLLDGHSERLLFRRGKRSGRVDASRRANRFELKTRGVQELTLLLPADGSIDFGQPVIVTVNGRTVHDAVVARDPAALLRWAARDNDRTMLYAASLRVVVP
jgi:predicted esterase